MKLRLYQEETVDKVFAEWNRGVKSTLVVSATGTGKTVVAGELCRRLVAMSKRILFVSHRLELMQQSAKALGRMAGVQVAREGGDYKELLLRPDAEICSGMVQSLVKRLRRLPPHMFDVILTDEAHHGTAKTYRKVYDHFAPEWMAGFTASPKRGDDQAMGAVFDSVAFEMPIALAIEQGWLTPIQSRIVTSTDLDLRSVKLNAGEFNQTQLKEQLLKQAVVDRIARSSVEIAEGRQTIIFCQNIEQSQAVRRVLDLSGENAVHVDGKIPHSSRRHRMDQFAEGRARFLCNCSVVEEGVDVPGIEVVANARPTRSQVRIIQSTGRGLRPIEPPQGQTANERRAEIAASTKPHCTVIDLVGQMGTKSLILSGDLLGGEYDDDVRAEAVQLAIRTIGEVDWNAIYKEAEAIVAARGAVQQRFGGSRRKEINWAYRYVPSPMAVLDIRVEDAMKVKRDDCNGGNLSRAIRFLEGEGFMQKDYSRLANYEQVMVARVVWKRSRNGMCSYKQARLLHTYGYKTDVSSKEASKTISRIADAGWCRPIEDGPNETFVNATGADAWGVSSG